MRRKPYQVDPASRKGRLSDEENTALEVALSDDNDAPDKRGSVSLSSENTSKVDWLTIDPTAPSSLLVKRIQNLAAARIAMGHLRTEGLSEEQAKSYISMKVREAHEDKERREAEYSKTVATKTATRARVKKTVEERLSEYIGRMINPQPQVISSYRELAALELRLEATSEAIDLEQEKEEFNLDVVTKLSALWSQYMVRYESLQKTLGITKAQLDAAEGGKSGADVHLAAMEQSEKWMAQELVVLTCPCGVEHTWLWWAFAHVHDPSPFFLLVKCGGCGHVMEVGDHDFASKVSDLRREHSDGTIKTGRTPRERVPMG